MRIPFSTLRYKNADAQTWGILLFRNYPRQYRYQLMSAPIPRGNNCLICRENRLSGLERLPAGPDLADDRTRRRIEAAVLDLLGQGPGGG